MKLVDILARELREWPENAPYASQSVSGNETYFGRDEFDFVLGISKADDRPLAVVTKPEWQKAREALSKVADSEQPDWSEAPEGFDYFIRWPSERMENHFYQLFGDRYVRDNGHYVLVSDVVRNPDIIVTKRPVAAEKPWNGEGLPPAGTMVEILAISARTEWSAAKVVFASRNVVVWDWDGEPAVNGLCTAYTHTIEVRPIRTPKQIAAEEREAAISEMMQFCNELPCRQSCADLYDAGYRKVNDGNQKA